MSRPTVNIEGLVGGYTGPGGKTILPHRTVAKLDLRLVPDMTADGHGREAEGAPREARLRRHRSRRTRRRLRTRCTTPADSELIARSAECYRAARGSSRLLAARGGSWPGSRVHRAPLNLPAGHFGMGLGGRAHAPDEYYLIESTNPKVPASTARCARSWTTCSRSDARSAPDRTCHPRVGGGPVPPSRSCAPYVALGPRLRGDDEIRARMTGSVTPDLARPRSRTPCIEPCATAASTPKYSRHDVQRHVDAGRQAACGGDAAVVNETKAAAQLDLREFLGELIPELVMRRRGQAIEQPCACELESTGTHGDRDVRFCGRFSSSLKGS